MYNTVFCVFMINGKTKEQTLAKIFDASEKAKSYVNESVHNDQLMGWENYTYVVREMMVH